MLCDLRSILKKNIKAEELYGRLVYIKIINNFFFYYLQYFKFKNIYKKLGQLLSTNYILKVLVYKKMALVSESHFTICVDRSEKCFEWGFSCFFPFINLKFANAYTSKKTLKYFENHPSHSYKIYI